MREPLDLVAMFEGLSPAEAKDLADRIRTAIGPEQEVLHANPNRIREKVSKVYGKFTRGLHRQREPTNNRKAITSRSSPFERSNYVKSKRTFSRKTAPQQDHRAAEQPA